MNEGRCLHIDDLVQERRNSSSLAMELCLSCNNPSIWSTVILCGFRREKQEQLQTICSGTSVMLAYEVQCSWVDSQGRSGEGGGVVNNSNNRSEVDERLCLQTKSRDLVWIPNRGGGGGGGGGWKAVLTNEVPWPCVDSEWGGGGGGGGGGAEQLQPFWSGWKIMLIWGLWCQKQVSQAGINNYIPQ